VVGINVKLNKWIPQFPRINHLQSKSVKSH
jgi:hypothetical protein